MIVIEDKMVEELNKIKITKSIVTAEKLKIIYLYYDQTSKRKLAVLLGLGWELTKKLYEQMVDKTLTDAELEKMAENYKNRGELYG